MPALLRSLLSILGHRHLLAWLAVASLAAYGLFVGLNAVVVPGGSDSSGYFNLARLLTAGEVHATVRPIEGLPPGTVPYHTYTPLGFTPTKDSTALAPTYPVGLPLLFAASALPLGWMNGPLGLTVLHAAAGLCLVYLLARQAGLRPGPAAIGAMTLAMSPLYVQMSVQAMSDGPALVWCAAAIWLALRSSNRSAWGCGMVFGMAVLIRPTNALLLLPIALALGGAWRRWLLVGLGGGPFAVLLLVFNHAVYGGALVSGYGDVNAIFSTEWVKFTLPHYARWLPVILSPFVLLVLGLPWLWRRAGRLVFVHATWIFLVLGIYSSYYHTHETWWYLRFVLPAFPSFIVLMMLAGRHLIELLPSIVWQRTAWTLGALLIALNGWAWTRHFHASEIGRGELVYVQLIEQMRSRVPPNSVIVAMQISGALFFSTDHVLIRWDMIDDAWPKLRDGARAAGRPIYALLWEYELKGALTERAPGKWRKIHELAPGSLWQLNPED